MLFADFSRHSSNIIQIVLGKAVNFFQQCCNAKKNQECYQSRKATATLLPQQITSYFAPYTNQYKATMQMSYNFHHTIKVRTLKVNSSFNIICFVLHYSIRQLWVKFTSTKLEQKASTLWSSVQVPHKVKVSLELHRQSLQTWKATYNQWLLCISDVTTAAAYNDNVIGLVSWEKNCITSAVRQATAQPQPPVSNWGRGPAQRHNKTTRILALMTAASVSGGFSCRCCDCLSRAAGMAAGQSISFHLIAELQNYIVSCHWLF